MSRTTMSGATSEFSARRTPWASTDPGCVEGHDLALGMHAGIGASGHCESHVVSQDLLERAAKVAADGAHALVLSEASNAEPS